jgi:hypothetical protein
MHESPRQTGPAFTTPEESPIVIVVILTVEVVVVSDRWI